MRQTCAIHAPGSHCDIGCEGRILGLPPEDDDTETAIAAGLDNLDGKTELGTPEATTLAGLVAAGLTAEEAEFILGARVK